MLNKIICYVFGHRFPDECSNDCIDYQIETITPYEALDKVIDTIHLHTCVRCRFCDLVYPESQKNTNVMEKN